MDDQFGLCFFVLQFRRGLELRRRGRQRSLNITKKRSFSLSQFYGCFFLEFIYWNQEVKSISARQLTASIQFFERASRKRPEVRTAVIQEIRVQTESPNKLRHNANPPTVCGPGTRAKCLRMHRLDAILAGQTNKLCKKASSMTSSPDPPLFSDLSVDVANFF